MSQDTGEILLQEFRDFRAEINQWRSETTERVTTLEAQTHDLCGNGQPGRMSRCEAAVSALQSWRWYLLGASSGVSGLSCLAGWLWAHSH